MSAALTPLGIAHARLIAGMHHVCFAEPWNENAMSELLLLPGVFGWLAGGDEPEGFVLARSAADEAEILTILVLPPYRGQGRARLLLDAVAEEAKKRNVLTLFLEVAASNRAALDLYTKVGFEEIGRRPRYYASGDALMMALKL